MDQNREIVSHGESFLREPAPSPPPAIRETERAAGVTPESTAFLLRATRVLAGSLDMETTLTAIAHLSLPHPGSWCILDLCDGERMRRVAVVHPVAEQQRLADALLSGWPPQRDGQLDIPSAVRTGRSELVFPVPDTMLVGAARSPENLALLRALQIGSLMTVPLLARSGVLGVLTFVAPPQGNSFSGSELAFAEELAGRCAMAIENSRLFGQAREAQAHAEEANLAKMRFLSSMSHELRTPLNAIAGYVELLESGVRGSLSTGQRRDLRRIRVNQRHLLSLVEAVLSFARADAGRMEFALADVELAGVLSDAETMVSPLAARKRIRLEGLGSREPDRGPIVYADREKLVQVLVNLLTNAVKFSPDGATIAVGWERVRGRLEIHVSDHGVGIAPEHLGRIFEPFVQVGEGLDPSHGGIGLGLAISRELAIGMGGDLCAESEPGMGSTFTLELACGRN